MKLNKNIYKSLALVGALTLASCGEDYLDTKPADNISSEDVGEVLKKDPSQVSSLLTGAYQNLYYGGQWATSTDNYGMVSLIIATDLMTEDLLLWTNAQWYSYDYQMDNWGPNYRRTASAWRELYQVVTNCNEIIELIKPAEGEEPNEATKGMLGEAYALRGYAYYWLINMWQQPYSVNPDAPGVPIKTESEYKMNRVPVKEVYDLIITDLEKGYQYTQGYKPATKGSINEYTAAGLLARALMFTGDYANAAKYAEIATKGGALNASELTDGMNSLDMSEALWGVVINAETTAYYASLMSFRWTYGPGYAGEVGYRQVIGKELLSHIADNDVRKAWFGYNDELNNEYGLGLDFSLEEQYGYLDCLQNKFIDVYAFGGGPFESDLIYLRTAEFYYVAAEAYYLNNQPEEARRMLNTIQANRVPGYNCTLSGQELYDEICWQKRVETWGEGVRFFDIKRRNETVDRSKSLNPDQWPDLEYMNALKWDGHDKRMIYQIPDVEMQNNNEITKADQNPS